MDWIDLRSDTVSWPTPEMRRAMAQAEVGDDVYGEDPSVNRLQERAAELTGKQAALFVASGTMGNLVAVLTHCRRGDEVILGDRAHQFIYEAGGMSALGGVQPRTVPNQADGTLLPEDVRAAVRGDDPHFPRSRLLCLENTHNLCCGAVLSAEYTAEMAQLAHEAGLQVHLDGARVFNAAAALQVPVAALTGPVDSVTFCLSKGLSAPAGSVLCGERQFIEEALRVRKMLGGGMRQAGVLAAAGLVALDGMLERLAEDHQRAQQLARGLAGINGLTLLNPEPQSNMVCLEFDQSVPHAAVFVERGRAAGIRLSTRGPRSMRLVTHYWVDEQAVQQVVDMFRAVAAQGAQA